MSWSSLLAGAAVGLVAMFGIVVGSLARVENFLTVECTLLNDYRPGSNFQYRLECPPPVGTLTKIPWTVHPPDVGRSKKYYYPRDEPSKITEAKPSREEAFETFKFFLGWFSVAILAGAAVTGFIRRSTEGEIEWYKNSLQVNAKLVDPNLIIFATATVQYTHDGATHEATAYLDKLARTSFNQFNLPETFPILVSKSNPKDARMIYYLLVGGQMLPKDGE